MSERDGSLEPQISDKIKDFLEMVEEIKVKISNYTEKANEFDCKHRPCGGSDWCPGESPYGEELVRTKESLEEIESAINDLLPIFEPRRNLDGKYQRLDLSSLSPFIASSIIFFAVCSTILNITLVACFRIVTVASLNDSVHERQSW